MPKPKTLREYDPRALGARCEECPLKCRGMLPVPPKLATSVNPSATIILEAPGGEEKYRGENLVGRWGTKLKEDLAKYGLHPNTYNIVNRIACFPPPNKRTDSLMRKAAKACYPRVLAELSRLDPSLPRLYFSKWSPFQLVKAHDYKVNIEIAIRRGVIHRNEMILPHPKNAYFHKPAGRAAFQLSLQRFVAYAKGQPWPRWPEVIIEPSEAMLEALRAMGQVVSADAETLGTDPLTSPITAVGISDGVRTISAGWCTYENRHGHYVGIADSDDPLHIAIRNEIKRVLETRHVIAHNAAYDRASFAQIGIEIGTMDDSMDLVKILEPEMPGNLEDAALRYAMLPSRWKSEYRAEKDADEKNANPFADNPRELLLEYNARDCLACFWLWQEASKLLLVED